MIARTCGKTRSLRAALAFESGSPLLPYTDQSNALLTSKSVVVD